MGRRTKYKAKSNYRSTMANNQYSFGTFGGGAASKGGSFGGSFQGFASTAANNTGGCLGFGGNPSSQQSQSPFPFQQSSISPATASATVFPSSSSQPANQHTFAPNTTNQAQAQPFQSPFSRNKPCTTLQREEVELSRRRRRFVSSP